MARNIGVATWKCSCALARLYFEKSNYVVIADQIEQYWKHCELNSNMSANVRKDQGWKRIEMIRKMHPELDLSQRRIAVCWFRFGFLLQSRGVSLSDRFLKNYAWWRKMSSTELGGTTIQWRAAKALRNGDPELLSYPLDYFLHAPNLEDISADIEVKLIHDIAEKISAAGRKKETTADHVGKHALQLIGEKIKEAATGAKIRGLTSTKEKGRYICHLSRRELADNLYKKFSVLKRQFKVSVIARAVGDFAACSRPWTK